VQLKTKTNTKLWLGQDQCQRLNVFKETRLILGWIEGIGVYLGRSCWGATTAQCKRWQNQFECETHKLKVVLLNITRKHFGPKVTSDTMSIPHKGTLDLTCRQEALETYVCDYLWDSSGDRVCGNTQLAGSVPKQWHFLGHMTTKLERSASLMEDSDGQERFWIQLLLL